MKIILSYDNNRSVLAVDLDNYFKSKLIYPAFQSCSLWRNLIHLFNIFLYKHLMVQGEFMWFVQIVIKLLGDSIIGQNFRKITYELMLRKKYNNLVSKIY